MEIKRHHIETRKEFERNLNLLRELMIEKKMNIVEDLENGHRLEISLLRARELPNKRFDFNTVNELLRVTANTAGSMKNINDEEKE